MFFKTAYFATVLILVVLITACSKVSEKTQTTWNPSMTHDNTVYLGMDSEPKSFIYFTSTDYATFRLSRYLFIGLTSVNGITGAVEPGLAERWEISADGLTWTFYLRPGLKWSDGMPLTADDIVFTFQDIIYNPRVITSLKDTFSIENKPFVVEKINDATVSIRTPFPFAPFLRTMSIPIYPKHKLKAAVDAGTFMQTWSVQTPPHDIIGTGPFMLSEYHAGEKFVFKKNPFYWKKSKTGESLPLLETVVIMIYSDLNAQMLAFQSGSVDAIGLLGKDYARLKAQQDKGDFTLYEAGPALGSLFLVFNQNTQTVSPEKIWFRETVFRQAVAQCIDRQTMIDNVFYGKAVPQYSFMGAAAVLFDNPEVCKYEYNIKKAQELLQNAGYVDTNNDGIIEKPAGTPVRFSIITVAGVPENEEITSIIVSDLRKIGLDVEMRTLDFNNILTRVSYTGQWDALVMSLSGDIDPHAGKNVFTSTGRLHFWNLAPFPPENEQGEKTQTPVEEEKIRLQTEQYIQARQQWLSQVTDWEKELDALFHAGAQELDAAQRKALYDRAQIIVAEQVPLIFTVQVESLFAVNNRLVNIKPSAREGLFHNIDEIQIKERT